MDSRPFRSVLYIPGSKSGALDKATRLETDAIIFDLEDAVAASEKESARRLLAEALETNDYSPRATMIRVNGFDSPWGMEDLETVAAARPEAILLPKVNRGSEVSELAKWLDRHPECGHTHIWAMMETPLGVLNAAEIAAAPRMAGFVMGTNDLAKEIGCRTRADREPLLATLQICLLAARAHGLVAVDGVYNAFRDAEGLRAECVQGRDMGFDGKTLIHPAQLDVANEVFAPAEAELDLARRQIDAWEEAQARGEGVAVVDGRIVENLHIETARRNLAHADAIARLKEAL